MTTTRTSLPARVKNRSDAEAWAEIPKLYAPLVYHYAHARELSREDANDVCDQCLEVLIRKIAAFEYDREQGRIQELALSNRQRQGPGGVGPRLRLVGIHLI